MDKNREDGGDGKKKGVKWRNIIFFGLCLSTAFEPNNRFWNASKNVLSQVLKYCIISTNSSVTGHRDFRKEDFVDLSHITMATEEMDIIFRRHDHSILHKALRFSLQRCQKSHSSFQTPKRCSSLRGVHKSHGPKTWFKLYGIFSHDDNPRIANIWNVCMYWSLVFVKILFLISTYPTPRYVEQPPNPGGSIPARWLIGGRYQDIDNYCKQITTKWGY
jgi:hypothetical protein